MLWQEITFTWFSQKRNDFSSWTVIILRSSSQFDVYTACMFNYHFHQSRLDLQHHISQLLPSASQLEGSRLPSFWSIRKRGPFGPPASRSKHTAAPAGVVFSSNTFIPPLPELRCALTSIFVAYLHKRQRHCLSMPAGCNYAERHSYLTAGWNCGRQSNTAFT